MPRHYVRALGLLCTSGFLALGLACGGKKPPVAPPPPPPPAPRPTATPTPPPPPPPPVQTPAPRPTPPPAAPTEAELFARKTAAELNREQVLDDVYFEYDKAELSDRAKASLQKNADYLRKWTSIVLTIEGHADARGTNEYNLALGERRAASARDYLVSLGVTVSRVNVLSRGEEQPFCTEETDACYAQNRRGHFVITAK